SSASAGCGLRGTAVIVDRSFRRGRTHDLSRMSRADLLKAFFLDSTVLTYVVMAAVGGGLAVRWAGTVWPPLVAVALTALLYPLAEYGLHRGVRHALREDNRCPAQRDRVQPWLHGDRGETISVGRRTLCRRAPRRRPTARRNGIAPAAGGAERCQVLGLSSA